MKTINSKREAALPYNGLQVLHVRDVEKGALSFEGQPPQVIVTFPNSTSLVNGNALPNGTEVQFYADEIVGDDSKPGDKTQPLSNPKPVDKAEYERTVTARAKELCEGAHGVGSWETVGTAAQEQYLNQARLQHPKTASEPTTSAPPPGPAPQKEQSA